MGKIVLEVKDADLIKIGEAKLREEIGQTLKWIEMKGLLKSIASVLSGLKIDYDKEISQIRRKAWHEYKRRLN